jgi:hypothetical protein
MNHRAVFVVAIVAVLSGAGLGYAWNEFLYTDMCLDHGGRIIQNACVGAERPVESLWEARWPRVAFTVVPPAAIGLLIFIVGRAFFRTGRHSDV